MNVHTHFFVDEHIKQYDDNVKAREPSSERTFTQWLLFDRGWCCGRRILSDSMAMLASLLACCFLLREAVEHFGNGNDAVSLLMHAFLLGRYINLAIFSFAGMVTGALAPWSCWVIVYGYVKFCELLARISEAPTIMSASSMEEELGWCDCMNDAGYAECTSGYPVKARWQSRRRIGSISSQLRRMRRRSWRTCVGTTQASKQEQAHEKSFFESPEPVRHHAREGDAGHVKAGDKMQKEGSKPFRCEKKRQSCVPGYGIKSAIADEELLQHATSFAKAAGFVCRSGFALSPNGAAL